MSEELEQERLYFGTRPPMLDEMSAEDREKTYQQFVTSVRMYQNKVRRALAEETPEQSVRRREMEKEMYVSGYSSYAIFSAHRQGEERYFYEERAYSDYYYRMLPYRFLADWLAYIDRPFPLSEALDPEILRLYLLLTRVVYVLGKMDGEWYRAIILTSFNYYCTVSNIPLLKALFRVYPLRVLYSWGEPIAFGAAQQGWIDVLDMLTEEKFDFDREVNGYTMLSVAVINNQIDVVDYLVQKGVKGPSDQDLFRFVLSADVEILHRLVMFYSSNYFATDERGFNIITHILIHSRRTIEKRMASVGFFAGLGVDVVQYSSLRREILDREEIEKVRTEMGEIAVEMKKRGYPPLDSIYF